MICPKDEEKEIINWDNPNFSLFLENGSLFVTIAKINLAENIIEEKFKIVLTEFAESGEREDRKELIIYLDKHKVSSLILWLKEEVLKLL